MISYEVYKWLHIVGLALTLTGTMGLLFSFAMNGPSPQLRKVGFLSHGIGLVVMLVAGFGMAARLGYFANLPGWIYAKIGLWIVLGGIIAGIKRKASEKFLALFLIILTITALGAYLAIFKPF